MPGSKVHFAWEISLFPLTLIGFIFLASKIHLLPTKPGIYAAYSGAYFFSSRFLSPDLDMKSSACRKRWGIFSSLWVPYALLFKHRKVSHNPLIGPLTRILYLSLILGLSTFVATRTFDLPQIFAKIEPPWYGAVLSGLYLPNLIHITVDFLE